MARFLLRFARDIDQIVNFRAWMAVANNDPWVESCSMYADGDDTVFQLETVEEHDRPQDEQLYRTIAADQVDRPPQFLEQPIRGFQLLPMRWPEGPNQDGDHIDHIPQNVREQVINQYLQNSEGRARLAASMVAPLRRLIDYRSAGHGFVVDQLPEGALPIYGGELPLTEFTEPDDEKCIIPEWLVPGAWMESLETGVVARVVHLQLGVVSRTHTVILKGWRNSEDIVVTLPTLMRSWVHVDEPHEGLPWYERLDDLEA